MTPGGAGAGSQASSPGLQPSGGPSSSEPTSAEQDRALRDELRLTFGSEAALYERSRPSFPREAVDWVIPDAARRAVDVGAGTGKLTRMLVAAGLEVTAVEPDPGMRAEFCRVLPDVPCLDGAGEGIPLPDRSIDVVTFAQSWHWVAVADASRETARVLRPGGTLALLWNIDARVPRWMVEGLRLEKPLEEQKIDAQVGPQFRPLQHRVFAWTETLPKETFIDRVMSRSRYLVLSDGDRDIERDRIRAAMDRDPEITDRDDVTIEHDTHCYRGLLAS